MSWFKRSPRSPTPPPARESRGREPHARPLDEEAFLAVAFVCSTCGRTDLPEAGDWDPPICQECDAAINFDALLEHDDFGID